jgi:hypothetical protein
MTRTSIDEYDPLRDNRDDNWPDPVAVWEANQPFEALNRRINPANQATAKQTRINQLRLEIASLESTVLNAEALLTARRAELTGLTGIPATSIAEPGSTFSKEIS